MTLSQALELFVKSLEGNNKSAETIRAYRSDIRQFITYLETTNITVTVPHQVEKLDVTEYLADLAHRGVTGITRARKVAALREFFRFCEQHSIGSSQPIAGLPTPRREKNTRTHLKPEEYNKLLALAGANPRDYAILQVFLQAGLRVSELCGLRLDDIDFQERKLKVRGKGNKEREIELEKKSIQALKSYLAVRPRAAGDVLFLNRYDEALGERGVRKIITSYSTRAGITKRISCHNLRHTFATHKAEAGVNPWQLKEWLGHTSIQSTQIYVHMARGNARRVMEETSL